MDCGGIVVLNLFAYRATDPCELLIVDDPVGPDNDTHLLREASWPIALTFIAAWGGGGNYKGRAQHVAQMFRAQGITLHCLGTTKDGAPRHPLRIAYTVEPQPWN